MLPWGFMMRSICEASQWDILAAEDGYVAQGGHRRVVAFIHDVIFFTSLGRVEFYLEKDLRQSYGQR